MARRRKKNIKAKKTYAFVVDGETEFWYLQMLKRNERNLAISIEPQLLSKKTLADQYEMVQALAKDYTKVFWIVDYDVIRKETQEAKPGTETKEQQFIRLRNNAQELSNVVIIVNDPCLDFWLLLHFVTTTRFFGNCNPAERELGRHMDDYEKTKKYYTKNDQDIYLKLKDKLAEAVERAKGLGLYDEYDTARAVCEMDQFFNDEGIRNVILEG